MSEYEVSVWAKSARSALKPLPRVRRYAIEVTADSAAAAVEVAYVMESTPRSPASEGLSRSHPRALPRVYVEIEIDARVYRHGDLSLKLEARAGEKASS